LPQFYVRIVLCCLVFGVTYFVLSMFRPSPHNTGEVVNAAWLFVSSSERRYWISERFLQLTATLFSTASCKEGERSYSTFLHVVRHSFGLSTRQLAAAKMTWLGLPQIVATTTQSSETFRVSGGLVPSLA
jgi:hypothetical protein